MKIDDVKKLIRVLDNMNDNLVNMRKHFDQMEDNITKLKELLG